MTTIIIFWADNYNSFYILYIQNVKSPVKYIERHIFVPIVSQDMDFQCYNHGLFVFVLLILVELLTITV